MPRTAHAPTTSRSVASPSRRAFAFPSLTPRRPSGPPPGIASAPKPAPAPKPSRRAILTGAVALLPVAAVASVSAVAAPAASPDAELIALCRAWSDANRRYFALPETGDHEADQAAADPVIAELHELVDRLDGVQARTADGIQARAALLHEANIFAYEDGRPERVGSWDYPDDRGPGQLLDQLLRDAAALTGLPAFPYTPSADRECAA